MRAVTPVTLLFGSVQPAYFQRFMVFFSRSKHVSVILLLSMLVSVLSLSPRTHLEIAARLETIAANEGIALQQRTLISSAQRRRERDLTFGARRMLQQTSTITENYSCGWYQHQDYDGAYSCTDLEYMDVEDECGAVPWSCAGSGATCTATLSTSFLKCGYDHLYTLASGDPASSLVTCENFAADAKEKSDTYHGEIADSECNMDDDKLEIHDQTFCGSTGPYMVYTLTVVDGGNPLSCTDSFSCDSATISSESMSCTISYGTPGPGPPSYSYSVPPPSGGRRGVSSAAAAGGSVPFSLFLSRFWFFTTCGGLDVVQGVESKLTKGLHRSLTISKWRAQRRSMNTGSFLLTLFLDRLHMKIT